MKKRYVDEDVVQAASKRFRRLFKEYDRVVINFSGGKDSTAALYLALHVAKEMGIESVDVVYVDHEIEGLGTIRLIEQVAEMPNVKMHWYALPFSLRNACSSQYPKWFPWHPGEKELWARDKPKDAITELPGISFEYDHNYAHPDGMPYMAGAVTKSNNFGDVLDEHLKGYMRKGETAISVTGIRAEESAARYAVMTRRKFDGWISTTQNLAYPIYDWEAHDVWKYIRETGLPYNQEYDLMEKSTLHDKLKRQRVGSVFAEESLRILHHWPEFYRGYWHKILERAEGVKTAWRYNNESIYTGSKFIKREGVTHEDLFHTLLYQMGDSHRKTAMTQIKYAIQWHYSQTNYPITDLEKDSCPLTGLSWEFLAKILVRGDWKTRQRQKLPTLSRLARNRAGISRDEAVKTYGKAEYVRKYFLQIAGRKTNAAPTNNVDPSGLAET